MIDPPAEPRDSEPTEPASESANSALSGRMAALNGGLARAVRAGADGEDLTASGVFDAIGGVRGALEAVVPSLVFIVLFVLTQDARLSALVPGGIAVLLVIVRLIQRETVVSALSGMLGVGLAVIITLITGRGVDYFLWGFVVNIAWGTGLLISVLVGWPALGLIVGAIQGDFSSWRKQPKVRLVATWVTVMWFGLFVARLAVQLPMYMSDQVGALGIARIVMGVPLFAIVVIVTWFAFRKIRPSSDDSEAETGVISRENTPPE